MKRFSVVVTHPAVEEALEAANYIAKHAPEHAAKWYSDFEKKINSLALMPARFAKARETEYFPGMDLRQALHHSPRIIFQIDGKLVRLLHIRHAAMETLRPEDPSEGGEPGESRD